MSAQLTIPASEVIERTAEIMADRLLAERKLMGGCDIHEAAALIKCGVSTARRWLEKHKVPFYFVGTDKRWRRIKIIEAMERMERGGDF